MNVTWNTFANQLFPESERVTKCREISKKASAAGWRVEFMEKKSGGCFTRWIDSKGVRHDTSIANNIEEALLLGCEAVSTYL